MVATNVSSSSQSIIASFSKINTSSVVTDLLLSTNVDFEALHEITGIHITDDVVHEICETNASILNINLNHCNSITDASLIDIGTYCKNVHTISLRRDGDASNHLTHVGLRSLAIHCPHIHTLDFVGSSDVIDDSSLRIVAASLKLLARLDLTGCVRVTDRGLSEVAQCCKKLVRLSLNGCFKIGESGHWSLYQVGKNCNDLEDIDLGGCRYISDSGILTIARGCRSLRNFNISACCNLNGDALADFFRISQQIVVLVASHCHPAINVPVGQSIVARISNTVIELDLSYCPLVGLEIMQCISKCSNLKILNLSSCQGINDEAIKILSRGVAKLESLELFYCTISLLSVNFLVPKDGYGLSYLGLNGCRDINASFLKEMSHLYIFSEFVDSDLFMGFRPSALEVSLRKKAQTSKLRLDAAQVIQRLSRGILVRSGVYREKKKEWTITNRLPNAQALMRGHRQRTLFHKMKLNLQQNCSATMIESCYRGYLLRKQQDYISQLTQIKLEQNTAALYIQRACHCHFARKIVSTKRYEQAEIMLKMNQKHAKMKAKSTLIQRNMRGCIARGSVKKIKESLRIQFLDTQRRLESSILIQKCTRGRSGRIRAKQIRSQLYMFETEWFHSRTIQSMWRGRKGRLLFKSEARYQELERQTEIVLKIQRVWRGYEGRHRTKYIIGLRALKKLEQQKSISIQRMYRGGKGRRRICEIRTKIKEKIIRYDASILIERLFRGYKGRQHAYIVRALRSLDWKAQPLKEKKLKREVQLTQLDDSLSKTSCLLKRLKKSYSAFEKELAVIEQTKSNFVDSDQMTGAPQRCSKDLVKVTLSGKIEEIQEQIQSIEMEYEQGALHYKQTETEIRGIKKELSILMSETTSRIKLEKEQNRKSDC